jgi:hypothetical protein
VQFAFGRLLLDSLRTQRGMFLVPPRFFAVARSAVVYEESLPRTHCIFSIMKRVCLFAIFTRHFAEPGPVCYFHVGHRHYGQ